MSDVTSENPVFEVPYDYLVVGVGARSNTFGTPGVEENAHFLKSIEGKLTTYLCDCGKYD